LAPNGARDQLITSHPDGRRIRNLTILPAVTPAAGQVIRTIDNPAPGYQLGQDGTRTFLGVDMKDMNGVAVLEPGPADAQWFVTGGGHRDALPDGKLCHDAPSAPGYRLE
jgi:hypothetical protein